MVYIFFFLRSREPHGRIRPSQMVHGQRVRAGAPPRALLPFTYRTPPSPPLPPFTGGATGNASADGPEERSTRGVRACVGVRLASDRGVRGSLWDAPRRERVTKTMRTVDPIRRAVVYMPKEKWSIGTVYCM